MPFELKDGDTVIMLSDSVLPDENGEKIISAIVCAGFTSSGELSDKIMKRSEECLIQSDDKTVLVIEIKKRSAVREKKDA
jgi:hypothetical protein